MKEALLIIVTCAVAGLGLSALVSACAGAQPRYPIGHCSADVVAMQRVKMTAEVLPAVAACEAAGNPEDCAASDEATIRWLQARQACR